MWREEFSEADQELDDVDIIMEEFGEEQSSEDDVLTVDEEDEERGEIRLRDRRVPVNYAEPNDFVIESSESDEDEITSDTSSRTSSRTSSVNDYISQSARPQSGESSQNAEIDNRPEEMESSDGASDDATLPTTVHHQNEVKQEQEIKKEVKQEATANATNDSDDVVDTCSICYEPFTSTSNHRIVSIKCGHIFGKECIERWLATKDSKRRCPKCNQTSNKNDVRVIYAKLIAAVDTTELDQTKQQLDEERKKRELLEQRVNKMELDLGMKASENIFLKQQISEKDELISRFKLNASNQVESNLNQAKLNSLNKESFTLLQKIDLKVDGCRLIVIAEILGYIVISQSTSPSSPWKGFGIRRIRLDNFGQSDFSLLHTSQIKDMALHPVDALLLTASLDKTVKLFNLFSKTTMGNFQMETTPWCVSWNKTVSNLFYVGLNNGYILECDATTKLVLKKINTNLGKPIKLINYLNHNPVTNRVNLLITSINSSFSCAINSSHQSELESVQEESVISKSLGLAGPIISSNIICDTDSGSILLTVRPSNDHPNNVQHYVSVPLLNEFSVSNFSFRSTAIRLCHFGE